MAWPDSFGTRMTLMVDTEEEFDWTGPFDRNARATTATDGLPEAHKRLNALGAVPNYLIDHPIATCERSVDILHGLIEDGRSQIGTQLHPWVNPPFDEEVNPVNSFTGNLPIALQAAKLDVLTRAIEQAFARRPIVYRAGRYGIGPETMRLLAEAGYRLDTSMRASYDYSSQLGPDYSRIPSAAFRTGPDGRILELPFTTVFIGRMRRGGAPLHRALGRLPKGLGIASRLGLITRVALTPEDMPLAEALEAVRVAVGEGVRVLNFAFHSPSVVPGHTPYVRDAADLAAFWGWWEQVLGLAGQLGVTAISLPDLLGAADSAR